MSTKELSLRMASGPVSRQEQISGYILDQIISGRWPPNHRLPSETELVKVLKVNRMTVHYALKELHRKGFVTRAQGLGTFVARPQTHLTIVKQLDIADVIRAAGRTYSARVITRKVRKATAAEAAMFRLPEGEKLLHAVILHLDNGVPIQLEDRLINPRAVPGCTSHDLSKETLFAFLMRAHPFPEGHFTTRAKQATAPQRKLLRLARGEPCLEVERMTWTSEHVVTVVKLLYPASRYQIEGTIAPREVGARL